MANNEIYNKLQLSLVASHPTAPSSGQPCRVDQWTGVALNDEDSDGNTVIDFGPKVWDLSVKAENDAGNSAVAIGDALYYVDADIDDGSGTLSKKDSGYFYGWALEAISSGQTDTIKVAKVMNVALGELDLPSVIGTEQLEDDAVTADKADVFVSTEQTATGSAQNVAHGLGGVPTVVMVVPTEHPGTPDTGAFDIAEGSHDGTNVVVTVTANVKFKVFAWL
ncbi:MAG: hypothetical protein DWQ07_14125 [Chloroflexi bacterium]|nr:MAG: hypothetical protein DWQ07_14125 [Chloroflexota bacterium]